jgi:hypothetical protein
MTVTDLGRAASFLVFYSILSKFSQAPHIIELPFNFLSYPQTFPVSKMQISPHLSTLPNSALCPL